MQASSNHDKEQWIGAIGKYILILRKGKSMVKLNIRKGSD
jgi:hypothetical protein